MLRIPSWAKGASITVNGEKIDQSLKVGSYAEVNRKWKKGDIVELELPMTPLLITADPNVEETRNQVAVKRGPLVYCLESADLESGTSINDIVVPTNITLQPKYEANILSGVTILEGEANLLPKEDWANQLYKPLVKPELKKTPIKMIPYFAWANRGVNDMSVWLPLQY